MSPKRIILLLAALILFASFLTGCAGPEMELTKTASPSQFNQAGDEITYTYTIKNTGISSNWNIALTDNGIAVPCPESTLLPGDSMVCSAVYIITQADVSAGTVNTTAIVTYYGNENCGGCGMRGTRGGASASFEVKRASLPALTLVKSVTPNTYASLGDLITFNLAITNTGNVPLTLPVVVTDEDFPNLTWQCPWPLNGNLSPGETITCSASFMIGADLYEHSIQNTASVSATFLESTVQSNSSSATLYFLAPITPTQAPRSTHPE